MPKIKRDTAWHYTGDVSPEDYGGKWYRRVIGRRYQVIELTNMDEACDRDNEGHDKYVVELSLVDLDQIPARVQEDAWRSCGYELPTDLRSGHEISGSDQAVLRGQMTAIACYEYGCKAPLDSWTGNGFSRLLREARKLARELKTDSAALTDRLDRPVNKLGSTASEYMKGDTHSAVLRGLSEGRPEAELMLKLGM